MSAPWVVTKRLAQSHHDLAHALGLTVVDIELFSTELIAPLAWPSAIGTALFTSHTAVTALGPAATRLAGTPVFCVGQRAGAGLRAMGVPVTAEGFADAAALAAFLVQFPLQEPLVHFCGAERRPELAQGLATAGVRLHEVPLYRRVQVLPFPALPGQLRGVAFVSPRGVAHWLDHGPALGPEVQLAALGPTTAEALAQRGVPNVVLAQCPTLDDLLRCMALAEPTQRI